jgi:hypothetical protein
VVPEHPLQRQIADALRLEIAPPGKVSGHDRRRLSEGEAIAGWTGYNRGS